MARVVALAALVVVVLALSIDSADAAFAIRGFTQHATFPPSGGLPFQTNLYLVYDTATNDALVIDTGFKTGPNDSGLLTFAANNNLDIQSVITTHPHPDHYTGFQYWAASSPATVLYVPLSSFLPFLNLNEQVIGDTFDYSKLAIQVADGAMIVGQQTLIIDSNVAVAECPVSALFYHSGSDSLFVGDNIFVNAHANFGPGVTGAHVQAWNVWLAQLLTRYKDDAVVYPGHGPTNGIDLATAVNNQLEYNNDFFLQLCSYRGNITAVAQWFQTTPRYSGYANGPLAAAIWGQNAAEWSSFYFTLTAQGICPALSSSSASAVVVAPLFTALATLFTMWFVW